MPAASSSADPSRSGAAAGPAGDSRAARKELSRIERRLEKITTAEQRLHDQLAMHATDHEKVQAFDAELRALAAERSELEDQWLFLADAAH